MHDQLNAELDTLERIEYDYLTSLCHGRSSDNNHLQLLVQVAGDVTHAATFSREGTVSIYSYIPSESAVLSPEASSLSEANLSL